MGKRKLRMKNEELKYKAERKGAICGNVCRVTRLLSLHRCARHVCVFILYSSLFILFSSCARMGQPDGGWYDEKPPRVLGSSPAENAINVNTKKVAIFFDEFVKVESASEKVMVSPPQHEQPEIKVRGRNIYVNLLDSLIPNTTYTIDFSDAIEDNNEGNPLGNYTYAFSTGSVIDTLEVSGYVLEASNLEPVKGILVGLYSKDDSIVTSHDTIKTQRDRLMKRVARTDSRGHFIIRGVAPGSYTIGAIQDADGDYRFTQRSEKMAFSHDIIVPTCKPDVRQDTVWQDKNHIKDIILTGYTHFMPDDIVLRAFDHEAVDRYFLKADRTDERFFTLFFTAPVTLNQTNQKTHITQKTPILPTIRLLNTPHPTAKGRKTDSPFVIEHSLKADTVTYWLKDTALVNRDTLTVEMTTYITDTLGVQRLTTDTLEILAKNPYAKRLKAEMKKRGEWKKELEKRLRRAGAGEVVDTIMPRKALDVTYSAPLVMPPHGGIKIKFPSPLAHFDSTAVHLYVEQDSLWYRAPFTITPIKDRSCEIYTDWIEDAKYSFEVDSLAFIDIYGTSNGKYKQGIQVGKIENYASLFINISPSLTGEGGKAVDTYVQLLDNNDEEVSTSKVEQGTAEFYYITPGVYYIRAFVDENGNGKWDTGDYFANRQPEETYYYNEPIECRAKWDLTKTWNPKALPLYKQKPGAITKQKADNAKTIKQRNAERARNKGIELPEYLK